MKELTFSKIENGKKNLIKLKNGLIEKFKKNIRIEKVDREYYKYEDNTFYGLQDVRNSFDQHDDDDVYEGIEYLFDESIMYYSFKNNGLGYNLKYIRKKKSGKLLLKCFNCKRKSFEGFDEDFIKKFTYRFCNGDIDKFMLLLRKAVYPYEYMDDWDRFNEEKLLNKSDFYSSLNMEDISEIDYRHATKVFDKFNIKNLGEYLDYMLKVILYY